MMGDFPITPAPGDDTAVGPRVRVRVADLRVGDIYRGDGSVVMDISPSPWGDVVRIELNLHGVASAMYRSRFSLLPIAPRV